jgi:hypothetical protein
MRWCLPGYCPVQISVLLWDDCPSLFSLKITGKLARALLMLAAFRASAQDFQNSSGDSNRDVVVLLANLVIFSSSTALMRKFI